MSAPVKCRGCGEVRATSCGTADCPVPLQMNGDLDTPAERIVRDQPICQLVEEIDALAGAVMTRTGRHGITRISLTPDVGLSFGIAPGTSADVATSAGRVEVYAEATPRMVGTYNLDTRTWTLPVQIDPVPTFNIETTFGSIPVFTDPTMPGGTIEMRSGGQTVRATVASPATDDVIRGLEKLRNETRSPERAQRLDAAIVRIQADEHELAKADRRAAEQERIITSYRGDVVAKLRAALTEALDAWQEWASWAEPRIAELRKLTEAP